MTSSTLRKSHTGEPTTNGGHFGSHDRDASTIALDAKAPAAVFTFPDIDPEPRTAESALDEWINTEELDYTSIAHASTTEPLTDEEAEEAAASLRETLFQHTRFDQPAEQNIAALAQGAEDAGIDLIALGYPLPVADPVPAPGEEAKFAADNARNLDRPDLRAAAAASTLLKRGQLMALARDEDEDVARIAQSNPNLTFKDIERLIDTGDAHDDSVLGRPDVNRLTASVVAQIVNDAHASARFIAAQNTGMHTEVLDTLMQDADEDIADAAEKTLAGR